MSCRTENVLLKKKTYRQPNSKETATTTKCVDGENFQVSSHKSNATQESITNKTAYKCRDGKNIKISSKESSATQKSTSTAKCGKNKNVISPKKPKRIEHESMNFAQLEPNSEAGPSSAHFELEKSGSQETSRVRSPSCASIYSCRSSSAHTVHSPSPIRSIHSRLSNQRSRRSQSDSQRSTHSCSNSHRSRCFQSNNEQSRRDRSNSQQLTHSSLYYERLNRSRCSSSSVVLGYQSKHSCKS